MFALMRLVMAPFVGRLVDAFGERVLLAAGIGVVAVSSALAGLSQSYWQLLVLRGAGGIGSIMFSVERRQPAGGGSRRATCAAGPKGCGPEPS